MPDAHANFAYSTVATAPSPASSGTSLVVATGDGSKFPAVPFNATVWPSGSQPLTSNAEIVRVTNISTDTLTITRTQEGTSARSIGVGDQIAATITAKTLTDAELWATPIEEHTASNSPSLDFTSANLASYDDLLIEFVDLIPATSGDDFWCRMGAGSFDTGSNYDYVGWYNGISDVLTGKQNTSQTSIVLAASVRNDTTLPLNGDATTKGFRSASAYKAIKSEILSSAVAASRLYHWNLGGIWRSTSAADRIQFLFSTGNISSGTIRIYGITK